MCNRRLFLKAAAAMAAVLVPFSSINRSARAENPTSAQAGPRQITELEARRDQIEAGLKQEWEIAKSDPLFRIADEASETPSTWDNASASVAMTWLTNKEKTDPEAEQKLARIHEAYSLLGLLNMLDTPHGEAFVHSTMDALFAPALQNYGARKRRELLIAALHRYLPGLRDAEVKDGAALWNTFRTNMVDAKPRLEQDIADLPKSLGWPKEAVRALGEYYEETVPDFVYSDYRNTHGPAGMFDLRQKLVQTEDAIKATTQAQTRP